MCAHMQLRKIPRGSQHSHFGKISEYCFLFLFFVSLTRNNAEPPTSQEFSEGKKQNNIEHSLSIEFEDIILHLKCICHYSFQ